jgi:hypothetical protein
VEGQVPKEEPLLRIAARRAIRRLRADAETPEFGRLLIYQALGAAGDAMVAVALAGSLFFSVPETEARESVALYLLLTMAPFAIIAPFLAALLDRRGGGMRAALVVASLARAGIALGLRGRLESLILFPLAFGLLMGSRAALIVRGALLPQLVAGGGSLVNANATLSRTSALAGILGGGGGVALMRWPGSAFELAVAAAVYAAGLIPAARLPRRAGRRPKEERLAARAGARAVSIRQAVVAVAGLRLLVGFLVIHLAFALRREDFGSLGLGLLVGSAAAGTLMGALFAPRLRRRLKEEGIIVVALILAGAGGLAVGRWFGLASAAGLVCAFGIASGAAKVAFDAIVQRDTPEMARGWAFARYEASLQLAWVCGALIPLLPSIPAGPGVFGAGVAANLLAIVYVAGRHRVRSAAMP